MVRKSYGYRRGTRKKFSKKLREKFKVTDFIREFKINDKVIVDINPISHKGMPFHRFQGKIGVVKEKRGQSYVISIKNGDKEKTVISRPEHLKPVKTK
jgi:large subunit ribosomal protein L21e